MMNINENLAETFTLLDRETCQQRICIIPPSHAQSSSENQSNTKHEEAQESSYYQRAGDKA